MKGNQDFLRSWGGLNQLAVDIEINFARHWIARYWKRKFLYAKYKLKKLSKLKIENVISIKLAAAAVAKFFSLCTIKKPESNAPRLRPGYAFIEQSWKGAGKFESHSAIHY